MREVKHINLSTLRKVFSLMGTKEKIVLGVLFLVALSTAWISGASFYEDNTVPAPGYGGTYREAMVGQPRLINPILSTTSTDISLSRLVYSGLYTYDEQGKLVPDLADGDPTVSEDQKEYTIKIKKDAVWHNDRPVTADDVIYTVQTIQNPNFKSPLRNDWANTTVEKVSDNEVRFKNRSVSAPFQNTLTLPILPQILWNRIDVDNFQLSELNLKAIGTGPYQVREITKLPTGDIQKITLESFHKYTGGRPFIDRLIISFYSTLDESARAYSSGEVSGFGYIPYTQNADTQEVVDASDTMKIPLPQYQALFFNVNNAILSDKNVRKALRMAVPKQQIIDEVFAGNAEMLSTPILPEQLGFKELPEAEFNLEAAANALNQLGWVPNEQNIRAKKNQKLELIIVTNDSQLNARTAEVVAREWRKLNITVNVQTLPTKELTDKNIRPRNFDVLLFGQKLNADPDPFAFWHSSQVKDPGLNVSGLNNAEIDSILTEARSTVVKDIRQDRYGRFLEIMNEEAPATFLNQGVFIYAVRPEVRRPAIQGIFDSSLRFVNISKWYIKEKRVWQ